MNGSASDWLRRIRDLPMSGPVRIMNVCGGHERSVSMAGLRSALPSNVALIPGPGCPVCICPEEDIRHAINIALNENVILVTFGDMLRVPINGPKKSIRSLQQAQAAGADIRPIASPLDAVAIAEINPNRTVLFFAAGFETTTAPIAAMMAAGPPKNLLVLLSARLTWPAVALLLESAPPGFDALIAPGHVATVMGPEQWDFVPSQHGIPTAVAGFSPDSLLAASYSVLWQHLSGKPTLDNCYPTVVQPGGNIRAQHVLETVMTVIDAPWRGIGIIPSSGFALRSEWASHDARVQFALDDAGQDEDTGRMPPGCACAEVVLGRAYPNECILYGRACTPRRPIGPCMVSDEGACRIWWASGTMGLAHSSGKDGPTNERSAD
ncbi:MAG: hydrogenase formation protein HypD [Rhodospirillaceae bacterium]